MVLRLVLLFFLFPVNFCVAQNIARNPETGQEYPLKEWIYALPDTFDLFDSQEPMKVRLAADFNELVTNKFNEDNRDASLYFLLNDTLEIHKEIRIQPRGNFRKKNCTFPPLTLNFKQTPFYVPQIQSFKNMKMVTDCVRETQFEIYVLREFLIYRLYNILTPKSFKVRLLDITYEDTSGTYEDHHTYAFLIEDIDDLADRFMGEEVETGRFTEEMFDPNEMVTFSIFQYMIGNQDWTLPAFKNIKIIRFGDSVTYNAIPYDFDYSGFVNSYYAEPKKHLGLATIRDRYFLGKCYEKEFYAEALQEFRNKKPEMLTLISSFPYLNKTARNDLGSYLESFFKQIEKDPTGNYFRENCQDP